MDGIKKVIQVFLIFLVLLAFASCNVKKTVGIPLFESSTDTLGWITSLPDTNNLEPGMDADQTTLVQNTNDFSPESVVPTEDSIIRFPASADTLELPMTPMTPKVSEPMDSTLIDDPVTKTIPGPVYSTVPDSAHLKLHAMLDTILINQKLLLNLYGTNTAAPAQSSSTSLPSRRTADTIVIKNEIYLTESKVSGEAPVSTASPVANSTVNPYQDTIQYLLFEIRSLKQQLANNNSPAAIETKSVQKETKTVQQEILKGTTSPGIQTVPVVIDRQKENYDSIRAQLNEIKVLLKEQQLRIDKIAAVQPDETTPAEQSEISAAVHLQEEPAEPTMEPGDTLSMQKIDLDVTPVNADKDTYNQEFFLTKLYDQRIQDTALLLQNQIDALEYELANQFVAAGIDTTITAFFGTGSNIALNEKEVLDQLTQLSTTGKITGIFLSGHTDKVGDPALNRNLSEQRVKSIQQKLIDIGFASQLIYSQYFGSEYASDVITDSDRRVDIRIEYE